MAKNKDIIDNSGNDIPNGYLTLKEAAERTEYTPDYIGQLIRAGKIEGKQIYSNVAWVANETSLRSYLDSRGKESRFSPESAALTQLPDYLRPLLYVVIGCSIIFLILLVHVLSVTIDKAMTGSFQDKADSTIVRTE